MPIANHARSATSPTRWAFSANKPCLDVAALLNQCEIRRNEIHPTTSQVRSNWNPIPARSKDHTAKRKQAIWSGIQSENHRNPNKLRMRTRSRESKRAEARRTTMRQQCLKARYPIPCTQMPQCEQKSQKVQGLGSNWPRPRRVQRLESQLKPKTNALGCKTWQTRNRIGSRFRHKRGGNKTLKTKIGESVQNMSQLQNSMRRQ